MAEKGFEQAALLLYQLTASIGGIPDGHAVRYSNLGGSREMTDLR